jgi:hypothetical protein
MGSQRGDDSQHKVATALIRRPSYELHTRDASFTPHGGDERLFGARATTTADR